MMANYQTKTLTIYNKQYKLPVLERDYFSNIQNQIQERQSIIKNKQNIKKSFFGIIKTTEKLTFEEQFHELESLVEDYYKLVGFLTEHKKIYQNFFTELISDLRTIVQTKLNQSTKQENKRLALLKGESDPDLIGMLENQQQQILSNVWVFSKAFLLILKKINLINEVIEKITTDQYTQNQYLRSMVEKLENSLS